MEDTQTSTVTAASGIGLTALGRLHLRVVDGDGYEEVVVERRWSDMGAARAWCERTLGRADAATTVLEIQVFEESWRHARSWETTDHRPVAEALQLGVVSDTGGIHWTAPRAMSPRAGSRHLL